MSSKIIMLKNPRPKWRNYTGLVKIFFVIYMLCLLWGTKNHIIDIWNGGFLPYTYAPMGFNVYWTSLTFLDPLAIILLCFLPYYGLVLAVFIMVSDIAVNLYATYTFCNSDIFSDGTLQAQILFGIFLFLTVPIAWKKLAKSTTKTA